MTSVNDNYYETKVCTKPTSCFTAKEILQTYQDAVVRVTGQFILLGEGVNTPSVPLGVNQRADLQVQGSGVLIKGGRILCPAQLVMAPPATTAVARRYPFQAEAQELGVVRNELFLASRIVVTINNVKHSGVASVYEARLDGIYGKGGFAVLSICDNSFNPCKHPYVKTYRPIVNGSCEHYSGAHSGDTAYVLGHGRTVGIDGLYVDPVVAMTECRVADVRYTEPTGWFTPEALLLSGMDTHFLVGGPVISQRGYLIGMHATDYLDQFPVAGETGMLLALNWEGMYLPFQLILQGRSDALDDDRIRARLVPLPGAGLQRTLSNARGTFNQSVNSTANLYSPGYLGVSYKVFNGDAYSSQTNYTSGAVAAGQPRFLLDGDGRLTEGTRCKDIQGLLITGVAGLNPNGMPGVENGYWFVPGGETSIVPADGPDATEPLFPSTPASPLLGAVFPGDVITHLEVMGKAKGQTLYKLGGLDGRPNLQSILDRLAPGDSVRIHYRTAATNYNSEEAAEVRLSRQPNYLNYPHYATLQFPDISGRAVNADGSQNIALAQYPAFTLPPSFLMGFQFQTLGRNLPGSGNFAPSI